MSKISTFAGMTGFFYNYSLPAKSTPKKTGAGGTTVCLKTSHECFMKLLLPKNQIFLKFYSHCLLSNT